MCLANLKLAAEYRSPIARREPFANTLYLWPSQCGVPILLAASLPAFGIPISVVHGICSEEQMVWSDTSAVVAVMTDIHSLGKWGRRLTATRTDVLAPSVARG